MIDSLSDDCSRATSAFIERLIDSLSDDCSRATSAFIKRLVDSFGDWLKHLAQARLSLVQARLDPPMGVKQEPVVRGYALWCKPLWLKLGLTRQWVSSWSQSCEATPVVRSASCQGRSWGGVARPIERRSPRVGKGVSGTSLATILGRRSLAQAFGDEPPDKSGGKASGPDFWRQGRPPGNTKNIQKQIEFNEKQ